VRVCRYGQRERDVQARLRRHPNEAASTVSETARWVQEMLSVGEHAEAGEIAMKLKVLPPNSPEAKRRDDLLAIMRDETKPEDERFRATLAALPLCHEEVPPIVVRVDRRGTVRATKATRR
jgi:hypothetical protein